MSHKVVVFFIAFLVSQVAFAQSPWVGNKGSLYVQPSMTFLSYDKVFTSTSGEIIQADYATTDLTIGLFGDYSVTDNTAIIVNIPFKSVDYFNQSLSGLGDPSIKIKHQISDKRPFAIHYGYTAPLSKREGVVRTGYSQHAFDLGLSAGIGREKFFSYASLGYRYRNNIPDQIIVDAEFGLSRSLNKRKLYLMLHLDAALNTTTTQDPEGLQSGLYHNDGEFVSPAVKVSYNVAGKFWLNLGAGGAVYARHLGAAPTLSFGVAYNLKRG